MRVNLKREIRVFFSQDFHIYGTGCWRYGNVRTRHAQSIIHYKRKRYFLINGLTDQNDGIYQFATGYKESFGREGTWKDAEDGDLQGNPIAQGSVDSAVSFKLEMQPESTQHNLLLDSLWRKPGRSRSLKFESKKCRSGTTTS